MYLAGQQPKTAPLLQLNDRLTRAGPPARSGCPRYYGSTVYEGRVSPLVGGEDAPSRQCNSAPSPPSAAPHWPTETNEHIAIDAATRPLAQLNAHESLRARAGGGVIPEAAELVKRGL